MKTLRKFAGKIPVFPAVILCCVAFVVATQAARWIINTGTGANTGTGDTLLVAFNKINSNFAELYDVTFTNGSVGAGNGIVKSGTNLHFATNAAYTTGLIPYANGTGSVRFAPGLFYDTATDRLTVGSQIAGASTLHVAAADGTGASGLTIGTGTGRYQLFSDGSGNDTAQFGNTAIATTSWTLQGLSSGGTFTLAKFRSSGVGDINGNIRFLIAGPSAIYGSDSSTNLIPIQGAANLVAATPSGSSGLASLRAITTNDLPRDTAGLVLTANGAGSPPSFQPAAAGSGGSVGLGNLDPTQFGTNGGTVVIKSEATTTNLNNKGYLLLSGRTNQLTISSTGSLLLDGVPIASSTEVEYVFNSWVSNLFTVNGNHNTMIVTQYVRLPWTTLTMSGSNVSAMNFAAASMFRVTLTNDGFLQAPSGLPGTNVAQTVQLFVAQDGTGGRALTATNGSWIIAGSGTSSNAVVSVTTNANAVTVLTFTTSPTSSSKVYGVVAAMSP